MSTTMTQSEADALRRQQLIEINEAGPPADSMTTDQMRELYEVVGFAAPYVVVTRKSDRQKGTLEFTHAPRRYFNFQPAS
jgi:hypothetical protein